MKKALCFLMVCLVMASLARAQEVVRGRLVARGDQAYPPYEFLDDEGKPSGFNVELIYAVSEAMGLEITVELGPWNEIRGDLEQGRIDIITGMVRTRDRDRTVDFSNPYITVSYDIFVRKGSAIRNLTDLADKEILVEQGEVMHDFVMSNRLSHRISTVEKPLDAVRLLSSGKYDCALLDKLLGLYIVRKHGLTDIVAVGSPFESGDMCFAVKEGDRALQSKLNEGLRIVISSGAYRVIYDKWFGLHKEEMFSRRLWRYLGAMAVPFTLAMAAVLAWLWTLKRAIAVKTAELDRKVDECTQAENTARESGALYRAIFENTGTASIIINKDTTIGLANTQWAVLSGYPKEECEGRKSWTEFVDQEDLARMKVYHDSRRDTPDSAPDVYEFRMVDRMGRVHDCVNHVAMIPGTQRSVASVMDITERKRAERDLQESRRMLADIIEFLPDATFVVDRDGKVITWNRAVVEMTGVKAQDMLGKGDYEYAVPFYGHRRPILVDLLRKDYPEMEKNYISIRREGDSLIGCTDLPDLKGQRRILWAKASPIYSLSGDVAGYIESVRDITEQKEAEMALMDARDRLEERVKERTAELLNANDELKKFAYFVSHDLRAPLINLKGFSAELRASMEQIRPWVENCLRADITPEDPDIEKALNDDIPEALTFIETSVSRMDSLINAVLQLSRIGRRVLSPETINMNVLVDYVIKSMEHQILDRGIEITVGELPFVCADRTSMEQVMANLIDNAVKYLSPGREGRIHISGEPTDEHFIFRIRDNGRGIAQEDVPRIFELFRRVGAQDVHGYGMGLNYVQTLIRRHGGRIWCESVPGAGTTFSFTIARSQPGTQEEPND